jgi:hypothetical protein
MPAKTTTSPGMKRTRTPFAAKLRPEMQPEVVDDQKGRGKMLLPTPMLVAQEIAAIPEGSLTTVSTLRTSLARKHGADLSCPLMTGIFFNIIAGAAEEQLSEGKPPVAPYWRVIRDDGSLSPKTPDGPDRHAEHLRAEGMTIEPRGSKLQVSDFQQRLVASE